MQAEDPQFKATNPVWWAEQHLPPRTKSLDWVRARKTQQCPKFLKWLESREGFCGVAPHLIKRLKEDHYNVPDRFCASEPLRPGVVALLVDAASGDQKAFIAPLQVAKIAQRHWHCHPGLPFTSEQLLTLLSRLMASLGTVANNSMAETHSFEIKVPLQTPIQGRSMHVAGLISVVRGAHASSPSLLESVAALVEPDGNRLIEVGFARLKLEAFVRELGRGTLLVRAPGGEAAAFDEHFDEVWEVEDFEGLAKRLYASNLLDPLLRAQKLGPDQFESVIEHARHMNRHSHFTPALHMIERLEHCTLENTVSYRQRQDLARLMCDLHRHLGHYDRAVALAQAQVVNVHAMGDRASHDSLAHAEVRVAAALYDSHNFKAIVKLLSPWMKKLAQDPRIIAPHTRVMLFNTLGRSEAVLGRPSFAEYFKASLRQQEGLDLANAVRTRNYLIHGYLKNNDLNKAGEALTENETACSSDPWLAFYRADLARRRGLLWSDDALEQTIGGPSSSYPRAFYFQATARMQGRSAQEAADRFREARRCLCRGVENPAGVLYFLTLLLALAEATWLEDATGQKIGLKYLDDNLHSTSLKHYYQKDLDRLHDDPGTSALEKFLGRVPYF